MDPRIPTVDRYGGALLECLVSRRDSFDATLAVGISRSLEQQGLLLSSNHAILIYTVDNETPVSVANLQSLANWPSTERTIINYQGNLCRELAQISLVLDGPNRAASLSTEENIIRPLSLADLDYRKDVLRQFVLLCSLMANEFKPEYLFLGSEELHLEDMRFDVAEGNGAQAFTPSLLTERSINEVFAWYMDYFGVPAG